MCLKKGPICVEREIAIRRMRPNRIIIIITTVAVDLLRRCVFPLFCLVELLPLPQPSVLHRRRNKWVRRTIPANDTVTQLINTQRSEHSDVTVNATVFWFIHTSIPQTCQRVLWLSFTVPASICRLYSTTVPLSSPSSDSIRIKPWYFVLCTYRLRVISVLLFGSMILKGAKWMNAQLSGKCCTANIAYKHYQSRTSAALGDNPKQRVNLTTAQPENCQ